MSPNEALEAAQRAAQQHKLKASTHAQKQMAQRGVQWFDLFTAIMTASHAELDPPGDKWKILDGKDAGGESLTVVVSFDSGEPRVVTVF